MISDYNGTASITIRGWGTWESLSRTWLCYKTQFHRLTTNPGENGQGQEDDIDKNHGVGLVDNASVKEWWRVYF